jgi:hypothetical protein
MSRETPISHGVKLEWQPLFRKEPAVSSSIKTEESKQVRFHQKQWGKIVARAWTDPEFKARLIAEPMTVLREHGIEGAEGLAVRVVEDEPGVRHLVLPSSPSSDLTEEELVPTAVSYCWCGYSGWCGRCGRCGCGCA